MADIRESFGVFVNAQWPAADSFKAPPPYQWPDSPVPVILDCWKRFRNVVLQEGRNGARERLVDAAKWLKFLLSAIRRSDFETQRYYPWLHALGKEMCEARLEWTVRYWWTCRREDRQWARSLEPEIGPKEYTIDPPAHYQPDDLALTGAQLAEAHMAVNAAVLPNEHELASMKRELGIHSGFEPAPNGRKRLAWVSWPDSIDSPEIRATARKAVGATRPMHV